MENEQAIAESKPGFLKKYRYFLLALASFLLALGLVFIFFRKPDTKPEPLFSPLPSASSLLIEEIPEEFEIPPATDSAKKILLKYNGGPDDVLYVKGLSLDKKWLAFRTIGIGKDMELINLEDLRRHELDFKDGYWEQVVWRSDNSSFYATAEEGLPEAGGGPDAFCLVYLHDLGNSSFNYEQECSADGYPGVMSLSPDSQKLARITEIENTLQIISVGDGQTRSFDAGNASTYPIKYAVLSWSPDSRKITYPCSDSIKMLDLQNSNIKILVPPIANSEIFQGFSAWSADGSQLAIFFERRVNTGENGFESSYWLDFFDKQGLKIRSEKLNLNDSPRSYLLWLDENVYLCPWEADKLWLSYPENSIIYQSGFLVIQDTIANYIADFCQPVSDRITN